MAGLELRQVPAADALAFARTTAMGFGNVATEEEAEATATEIYDPEWAIGVYDDGQIVATASSMPMELTLPAGSGGPFPVLSVQGVTGVAVLPTHRRQGLLNRMMAYQLDRFHQREVPLAILTASESIIYGRYGYGLATSCQSVSIATERSAFVRPQEDVGPSGSGRIRLVAATDVPNLLPALHNEARRLRPGEISRSKEVWHLLSRDPERHRRGASARMYAVHESDDGVIDGYATYRYRHNWKEGLPGHTIAVEDLYATSPAVEAAIWRFLLDIDLVEEVTAGLRPLDDPLRWRLADPRRLRTTAVADFLWARLVDIPAALASRGYNAETELVLQVEGPSTERFVLRTASAGGTCHRADEADHTDLVLGLSQLGAIFLGGCRPSVLAAAGLIDEARPGALARADAAFAGPLLPFCGTHF